jgi:hypothetical protein
LDFFLVFTLILPLPVPSFGFGEPLVNQVYVSFRRRNASLRFLLKRVQNVDGFLVSNRVNRSPRIATVVRDNFECRSTAKAAQRLCRRISLPLLGSIKGIANVAPD